MFITQSYIAMLHFLQSSKHLCYFFQENSNRKKKHQQVCRFVDDDSDLTLTVQHSQKTELRICKTIKEILYIHWPTDVPCVSPVARRCVFACFWWKEHGNKTMETNSTDNDDEHYNLPN